MKNRGWGTAGLQLDFAMKATIATSEPISPAIASALLNESDFFRDYGMKRRECKMNRGRDNGRYELYGS